MNTSNNNKKTHKLSRYLYEDTKIPNVKKIVNCSGGYMAIMNFGIMNLFNDKTGEFKRKSYIKYKVTDKLSDARALVRFADECRAKSSSIEEINAALSHSTVDGMVNAIGISAKTVTEMLEGFKRSNRYLNLSLNYRDHYRNYMNHLVVYFGKRLPSDISTVDIENYFRFLLEKGSLSKASKNKSNHRGISVNTVSKHKMSDGELQSGVTAN